jgi:hypothetical protein
MTTTTANKKIGGYIRESSEKPKPTISDWLEMDVKLIQRAGPARLGHADKRCKSQTSLKP